MFNMEHKVTIALYAKDYSLNCVTKRYCVVGSVCIETNKNPCDHVLQKYPYKIRGHVNNSKFFEIKKNVIYVQRAMNLDDFKQMRKGLEEEILRCKDGKATYIKKIVELVLDHRDQLYASGGWYYISKGMSIGPIAGIFLVEYLKESNENKS